MLYILLGEDDFSQQQALDKIKNGIGDMTLIEANTSVLNGSQVTADQLRMTIETVPFLAEKRLCIVNGLLGRFEAGNKPAGRKSTPAADVTGFIECIIRMPPSTVLILIDGGIKSTNPLLKGLSAQAEVRQFKPLGKMELPRWVEKQVKERDSRISPAALELLCRLVGNDLWTMNNELDKLSQFASGRLIEEADVRRLVSSAREANVFAMVDAVLESRIVPAEQILQQLLQEGDAPPHILAMLTRQVRLIVRAKELKRQGRSDGEIQSRLGVAEFVMNKTLEQINKFSWDRLKTVYRQILETDLAIKTGRFQRDDLALCLLVAELCLSAPGRPAVV